MMPHPSTEDEVHTVDVASEKALTTEEVADAHACAEKEKAMGFRTVIRLYYKAAFWSAILSCALIMEGYDLGVVNSFWAQPEFLKRFGKPDATGKLYVDADWQAAVNNAALIGEMIGLCVSAFQIQYEAQTSSTGFSPRSGEPRRPIF